VIAEDRIDRVPVLEFAQAPAQAGRVDGAFAAAGAGAGLFFGALSSPTARQF
jgi:hypothetical protein